MYYLLVLINQPKILFWMNNSVLDQQLQNQFMLLVDLKKWHNNLLTTHDMNEATLLCDNLALVNTLWKEIFIDQKN